jgi:hypothetical protein
MAKSRRIKENAVPKETSDEKPLLSEKEVWDVVEFARAYSGGIYGASYLTPDLVSARMKDITLNPLAASQTMLDAAMISPKESEKQLQEFSQSFELSSMIYKRLISYLANMLSFDVTYTSTAKPEDYKTPKYKKDLDAVEKFLDRFDYRKELRVVTKELLRNDAYFACFVDAGDKFVLQELPSEYCKITGRWEGGFLFSFNMYWFLQPGVSLDMYPPFFAKKYKEIWSNTDTIKKYDPALPPEMRAKSSWIYWVDVPTTLGVCFKLTPELATRLPYFSPLFNDLILQSTMRNLQKNISMAAASKIIMGEVPMLNRDAKATVKDTIAISPDLLGKFMALVKSAISEAVKVASAPLTNIQGIEFKADNEMYNKYLSTTLATTGINTNLIFTSGIKPNVIETQLSLNVDEQMMTALYEQFNEFMNYFINKYTRTFKFNLVFEGTDFFLNRNKRLKDAMDLFDKGIVMPQKIAAAMGMKPAQLRKHMEESAATDFMSKLTVPAYLQQIKMQELQQEGTMEITETNQDAAADLADKNQEAALETAKLNKANAPKPAATSTATKGRPKKSDSEISDEGAATRAQGTNIGRGGKT